MSEQQPDRPQHQGWRDSVVVEICEERNRFVMWNPRGIALRGRWSRANLLENELIPEVSDLPEIPGIHLALDGAKRVFRIFDPLNMPEHKEFWEKLRSTIKARFIRDERPEIDIKVENISDTDVKTTLYWLRRIVTGRPLDPQEIEQNEKWAQNSPTAGFRRWSSAAITAVGGMVPQAIVRQGVLPDMKAILALPGRTGISQHDHNFRKVRFLEDHEVFKEGLAAM